MIVYVPAATPAPITNVQPPAMVPPAAIVQVAALVTKPAVVDVIVAEAPARSNPDPVSVIMVPGGPSKGDGVIDGTENGAVATSPAKLEATRTV